MALYRFLNPLRLYVDTPLRNMCAAVLSKPLDKGKLLLYGPCCQGIHQLITAHAVAQADSFKIGIGIYQQSSLYDRRGDS